MSANYCKIIAHVQEQPNSQPDARLFKAWTTISNLEGQDNVKGSRRENLTSGKAIAYAVEAERLAIQDGVKFERRQYLIY